MELKFCSWKARTKWEKTRLHCWGLRIKGIQGGFRLIHHSCDPNQAPRLKAQPFLLASSTSFKSFITSNHPHFCNESSKKKFGFSFLFMLFPASVSPQASRVPTRRKNCNRFQHFIMYPSITSEKLIIHCVLWCLLLLWRCFKNLITEKGGSLSPEFKRRTNNCLQLRVVKFWWTEIQENLRCQGDGSHKSYIQRPSDLIASSIDANCFIC